jgi:uncharacterized protein (TIGR03437 family)
MAVSSFIFVVTFAVWTLGLAAQTAIIGPVTGSAGDVLTYQVTVGGAKARADHWSQGFNPDRYTGHDYATSFRLTVTPQADGSVQIVAPAPGRYRLVARVGTETVAKAVLIRPKVPAVPIRGMTLTLSQDGHTNAEVRSRAAERLAVVKHLGAEWIALTYGACLDLDVVPWEVRGSPSKCNDTANLSISPTEISLGKYKAVDSGGPTLGRKAIPGGAVGKWFTVGLTAVGSRFIVTLDGTTVIDATDVHPGLASGKANWHLCCSSDPTSVADFDEILVKKLSPVPVGGAPFLQSIVNAASYAGVTVAPGEIVTLFGSNMGPGTLAQLQLDGSGSISTSLAGTRVLFGGVPAPLIYAQANQISALVPFGVSGDSTSVQVEYQGKLSPALSVDLTPTLPGIFTADGSGEGQAAALNQDGSYNSNTRPASRGSYVTLFLTGHGAVSPVGKDGAVAGAAAPVLANKVDAWIGQRPAKIAYAGVAPYSTYGLMQINLEIPADAPTGPAVPVLVGIGTYVTQPLVTVAVQ